MIDKLGNQSRLIRPHPPPARPRKLVWSGYAVFLWSIAYMLPHLYWALGGTLGLSLLKPSVLELAQWELINALGGLYVLDVTNHQDALTWAQQIPTAKYGQVEVCEIVEF